MSQIYVCFDEQLVSLTHPDHEKLEAVAFELGDGIMSFPYEKTGAQFTVDIGSARYLCYTQYLPFLLQNFGLIRRGIFHMYVADPETGVRRLYVLKGRTPVGAAGFEVIPVRVYQESEFLVVLEILRNLELPQAERDFLLLHQLKTLD